MVPLIGTIFGWFVWVNDLGERIIAGGLNFIIDRLDAIDTTAFSNASFASVAGIGIANAVFPLSEAITMWSALFTAMLAIIVIRWVKSFIPTVSN
ncbi:hypothetical protein HNR46_000098 [Haloferula luteola]|uniref:Uncharacterized protein n=2 Tax=Haloferula luteola TaxID=595692 RepID=A0A840UUK4_9BACT|nr:hypothetical protein [Haloferula luteola]